jgi:hypothetical protein
MISSLACLGPVEILVVLFVMYVLPVGLVFVVIGATVCGISSARKERRIRRQLSGLCATCGYNLCASPVRCPECGTPVPRVVIRCSAETASLLPEGARRWCESATRHT